VVQKKGAIDSFVVNSNFCEPACMVCVCVYL